MPNKSLTSGECLVARLAVKYPLASVRPLVHLERIWRGKRTLTLAGQTRVGPLASMRSKVHDEIRARLVGLAAQMTCILPLANVHIPHVNIASASHVEGLVAMRTVVRALSRMRANVHVHVALIERLVTHGTLGKPLARMHRQVTLENASGGKAPAALGTAEGQIGRVIGSVLRYVLTRGERNAAQIALEYRRIEYWRIAVAID